MDVNSGEGSTAARGAVVSGKRAACAVLPDVAAAVVWKLSQCRVAAFMLVRRVACAGTSQARCGDRGIAGRRFRAPKTIAVASW